MIMDLYSLRDHLWSRLGALLVLIQTTAQLAISQLFLWNVAERIQGRLSMIVKGKDDSRLLHPKKLSLCLHVALHLIRYSVLKRTAIDFIILMTTVIAILEQNS